MGWLRNWFDEGNEIDRWARLAHVGGGLLACFLSLTRVHSHHPHDQVALTLVGLIGLRLGLWLVSGKLDGAKRTGAVAVIVDVVIAAQALLSGWITLSPSNWLGSIQTVCATLLLVAPAGHLVRVAQGALPHAQRLGAAFMSDWDWKSVDSFPKLIAGAGANWHAAARLAFVPVVGAVALGFAIVAGSRAISPMELEVTDAGSVRVRSPGRKTTTLILLSPTGNGNLTPWTATGVWVAAGDELRVSASGKICLAHHRLIGSADGDTPPPQPWIGPEGLPPPFSAMAGVTTEQIVSDGNLPRTIRPQDFARSNHTIAARSGLPSVAQGALLGFVTSEENPPPWLPNGEKEHAQVIGRRSEFKARRSGQLFLAVNDVWLSGTSRDHDVYLEGHKGKAAIDKEKEWQDRIVKGNYWNVWYDDNGGAFSVTIEAD